MNIYRLGMIKVGRGTPEFTPVKIRALPARATQIEEAGSSVPLGGEDVTCTYLDFVRKFRVSRL